MNKMQTYAVESASTRDIEKRLQLTGARRHPFAVRVIDMIWLRTATHLQSALSILVTSHIRNP